MPRPLCRRLPWTVRRIAAGLLATLASASTLLAQVPGAPAAPGAPAGAPPPVPVMTRPLYMEWAIVALMVGLALFVVCKSSRRN